MTNEEIDKLEAGRELDALVADKVMGEDARDVQIDDAIPVTFLDLTDHYSTDIRAAWKLACKFPFANITFDSVCWSASLHNGEKEFISTADISNPSAPLAICRAALKAVKP